LERASTLDVRVEGPKPILMGRHLLDLGWKPGKEMGTMLHEAFEAQLDGAFDTIKGALDWFHNH